MVSILKQPDGDSKGILVFTHKERDMFLDPIPPLQTALQLVKESYLVGMHWGHYAENVGRTPNVDFHLAGSGTVRFTDEVNVPILNFCSRNFVPEYFTPTDAEATWDIVTIAPPTRLKRLSELLELIRETRSQGSDVSALFVCPRPKPFPGPKWDVEFVNTFHRGLTQDEMDDIKLISPLRSSDDIYPIPHRVMPHFYNIGKTFALFSKQEGESRVISESLMTGTPVIARSDLKGGGLDYLDEKNSRLFSSKTEAIDTFHDVSKESNDPSFDPSYLQDELYAPKSRPRFESALKRVFDFHDVPYRGELVDGQLSFLLPSHSLTLPPYLRIQGTNDLKDQVSMLKFCNGILGTSGNEHQLKLLWYRYNGVLRDAPSSALRSARDTLWKIEQRSRLNLYSILQAIKQR